MFVSTPGWGKFVFTGGAADCAGIPSELLYAIGENQLVESCTKVTKQPCCPIFMAFFIAWKGASQRAGVHAVSAPNKVYRLCLSGNSPRWCSWGCRKKTCEALLTARVVGFRKHFCNAGDVSVFS